MENKTIFEKIIDRELASNILYEDEKHIAFLDAFPFEKGHLLVVPKKVYETVWEMPEDEFLELQKIVLKFAKKIRREMDCGLNILQNNLKIAGQVVPHVHFHLVPRFEDKNIYSENILVEYASDDEKKDFENKLKTN